MYGSPYYPAQSMRGSGIYAYEIDMSVECENSDCDFTGTVEVHVDDWNNGTWECEKCEHAHNIDMNDIEEDVPDDDYYYDEAPANWEP